MEKIYGLLGHKLGHSYSPKIHKLLGEAAGEDYNYGLFETEPEDIKGLLKREDLGGLNVTIPYKQTVLPFCDVISDEVLRIGAANTIVKKDGKLTAYNTDILGFRYMVYASGISVAGKKVLVLGSGGASKAVICALSDLGARETVIISRKGRDNYENIYRHTDADIIVNTTPVGMYPNNLSVPLDIRLFKKLSGVLDLVYNPTVTGILLAAEELGIPHLGGLHMLTAQAKASCELFLDRKLADNIVRDITEEIRRDTENIILIGMPGSGKTSVGRAVANRLGREFIDTDAEIEKDSDMTIPEIFKRYGEPKFRELEHKAVLGAGMLSGKVISLGGGAVTNSENYSPLHQNGRIFFVKRDLELLETAGRPLSTGPEALREMYEIRLPMYLDFCDAEITNNESIDRAAEEIINRL